MPKHIVIGYDGPAKTAKPTAVYVGESGDAALAAMAADTTSFRFEKINNPSGLRKSNPNYQPPAAPAPDADAPEPVSDPEPEPQTSNRRRR